MHKVRADGYWSQILNFADNTWAGLSLGRETTRRFDGGADTHKASQVRDTECEVAAIFFSGGKSGITDLQTGPGRFEGSQEFGKFFLRIKIAFCSSGNAFPQV